MTNQKKYIKKVIVDNPESSAEARAERLRRVRNIANLAREAMCNADGLNINTYKGWEIARYGGLPVDGAEKCIMRVSREGVVCTVEWLLHGIGIGPYIVPDYQKIIPQLQQQTEHENPDVDLKKQSILTEIKLFKKHFAGAMAYEIDDDGLAPYYQPGDLVAGVPRYQEQIRDLVGKDCIVQAENGLLLVRHLRPSDTVDKYTLVCTNVQTSVKKPMVYDVALISAAPIIRHYRKDF